MIARTGWLALLGALAFIVGCETTTTTEAPADASTPTAAAPQPATAAPAAATMVVVEEGNQATCPVMGGKIVKNQYTDYKGQRLYFCCPGCEGSFKQDPEKFIAKLKDKGVTLAKVEPATK